MFVYNWDNNPSRRYLLKTNQTTLFWGVSDFLYNNSSMLVLKWWTDNKWRKGNTWDETCPILIFLFSTLHLSGLKRLKMKGGKESFFSFLRYIPTVCSFISFPWSSTSPVPFHPRRRKICTDNVVPHLWFFFKKYCLHW